MSATKRSNGVLTPLEIASHVVVGPTGQRTDQSLNVSLDAAQALERAIRPALLRAPCLVSFSGGHDSSLILGVAVGLARREGLPLPIPITWRFTDAPRAEESDLQEAVIRSLELVDWVRLDAGDDLDLVGPVAQEVLRHHGLLYPANAFLHAPLFARASGGTLLTGFGGDHVLGPCIRSRRPWWLAKHADSSQALAWLQPHAFTAVRRSIARERHDVPRSLEHRARWRAERRDVALACESLAVIAVGAGCEVAHPLLEAGFLGSLERSGVSPETVGGRAWVIRKLFGDAVPEACVAPRPKAIFREVFWRRHTGAFLSNCDLDALDNQNVDRDGLRREWNKREPNSRTALLVQNAWLAGQASSVPDRTGHS